ncbi:MAG: hypothetical protein HKN34_01130 [Gammaproteobacteria bacterium]|nr:hypothetical protein [Gammaproteobacteria bacterium]
MLSTISALAADKQSYLKTPLLGITAVADEESEVVEPESAAGGALEMSRYFATHLHSELVDCGMSVTAVFKKWLKNHDLIPVQETSAPDRYFMRVWDLDKTGVFEARYQVSSETESVRVSLDFYEISGNQLVIQDINRTMENYRLSSLWESLAEAIECDPA